MQTFDTKRFYQAGGSLAAISSGVGTVLEEPLPVNLAYYTHKQVEKVPYMGSALAQTTLSRSDYSGPMLNLTFVIWQLVRDIAYGMIAVFMIMTGILIMTRKRISAQAVVTVQYAIPRIIIALVLITFSYPIGATLASLGWALKSSVSDIVYSLAFSNLSTATPTQGFIINLLVSVFMLVLGSGGAGLAILTFSSGGIIVAFIVYLIIQAKMLIVYFKIIIKTVSSPLTFALSAIPGNDKQVADWFKEMLILVGSLLGMQAIIIFTNLLVGVIVSDAASNIDLGNPVGTLIFTGNLGIPMIIYPLVIPFILIFGYFQAWNLPKNMNKTFMDKRR